MNVYLCGQKFFGASVLRAIIEQKHHKVVGVSSPPPPDRLARAADLHSIPWMKSGLLRADTLPAGVDVIVAAHSHDFVGERTRFKARYGGIGYHPSLLPRHRGRDAIRWTIRLRDYVTGGTVYRLSNKVDGGDILAQEWCWVQPGDDAETLWRRDLSPMGIRLLLDTLDRFASGDTYGKKQDEKLATWEPSLNPPPLSRPDLLMLPYLADATGG